MKLYNYYRSSASFRVRIALQLKSLSYDYISIHLAKGEQFNSDFKELSGLGLVPLLEIDHSSKENKLNDDHLNHENYLIYLNQSLAIIEYLDEVYPNPALLPQNPIERAQVRALAQMIACEIHPINNLRVLKYLKSEFKFTEENTKKWYQHWVREGLKSFEKQLNLLDLHQQNNENNNENNKNNIKNNSNISSIDKGNQPKDVEHRFCFGNQATLADCCLIPQIFNAFRFGVSIDDLPKTKSIFESCMKLEAFQNAQPSVCPDAE